MNPYVKVLKEQVNYLEKLFESRKDLKDEFIIKEKDFEFNSPLNVIPHTINNLIHYSNCKFDPMSEVEYEDLFENIQDQYMI